MFLSGASSSLHQMFLWHNDFVVRVRKLLFQIESVSLYLSFNASYLVKLLRERRRLIYGGHDAVPEEDRMIDERR